MIHAFRPVPLRDRYELVEWLIAAQDEAPGLFDRPAAPLARVKRGLERPDRPDVLLVDDEGRLLAVDVSVEPDDESLLVRGLLHVRRVQEDLGDLVAIHREHPIDPERVPSLALLAPSFSEATRAALRALAGVRVVLYAWRAVEGGGGRGLVLERLTPEPAAEGVLRLEYSGDPLEFRTGLGADGDDLSEAEVAELLGTTRQ